MIIYIEYLDASKHFVKVTKWFNSEEKAAKWGRKNLENFSRDMIRYK